MCDVASSVGVAGGVSLRGRSRAGVGTALRWVETGWLLDCGVAVDTAGASHVFVTHSHLDHIANAPLLARTCPPHPTFHVPAEACDALTRFIAAADDLDGVGVAEKKQSRARIVGHGCDEVFSAGSHDVAVKTFRTVHVVPSIGYAFFALHRHLRPELVGMPQSEIAAMARAGQKVNAEERRPLFAYLGDTTPEVFVAEPWILGEFPVVVTEATFLDDSDGSKAEARGHSTWTELRPFVEQHPQTTFVLTHASMRYSTGRVRDFFSSQGLPNVIPFLGTD